jgi:hypothetical protein
VLQQCGLPHSRLAADHQRPALAGADRLQQPTEFRALGLSTQQIAEAAGAALRWVVVGAHAACGRHVAAQRTRHSETAFRFSTAARPRSATKSPRDKRAVAVACLSSKAVSAWIGSSGGCFLWPGGIPDEAMSSTRGCRTSADAGRADLQRLTVPPLTQIPFV